MSVTDALGNVLEPLANRPFLRLAEGLTTLNQKLQPAAPGAEPSVGDRIVSGAKSAGPLADTVRKVLGAGVDVFRWLKQALDTLEPYLVRFDVVLATVGVVTATLEGGKEAVAGLVSLSAYHLDQTSTPDQLFRSIQQTLPDLHAGFRGAEDKLDVIPPPEDIAAATAILNILLADKPAAGIRSLVSLQQELT